MAGCDNCARPVIRLLDWQTDLPDSMTVTLGLSSRFTLDGLLITGRGVHIEGENSQNAICAAEVTIRHSTLVPGWAVHCDCEPKRPAEPSLELFNVRARVTIEHSIVGSIQVNEDEVTSDPIPIYIYDSVLDATSHEREAIGAPDCPVAHAVLTIARSTVFGQIQVHAIKLAENSIFAGLIKAAQQRERDRVRPQFNSMRYGTPTFCQLSDTCAEEITRGADDESELGAFHDLFQPQREANLCARLDEYTPASMQAGIIYAS